MMKSTVKPVSISLANKDVVKVDLLANLLGLSRSNMIRNLIRGKRIPKQAPNLQATKPESPLQEITVFMT